MNNKIKKMIQRLIEILNKNSIFIGLKKGILMDTLPSNIRWFIDLPIIRIFRVIGGLSLLFMFFINNGLLAIKLPKFIFYLLTIIALLQLIQIVIISIIKFIYGINKLLRHRKDFEIRN